MRTHLGRYVAPTIAGELGGFTWGLLAGAVLFRSDFEKESLVGVLKASGLAYVAGRLGGIAAATAVSHDWKNVLITNVVVHGVLVGGMFAISPTLSGSPVESMVVLYYLTAPIITMTIASMVDSAYAKKLLRVSLLPQVTPGAGESSFGLSLSITGF